MTPKEEPKQDKIMERFIANAKQDFPMQYLINIIEAEKQLGLYDDDEQETLGKEFYESTDKVIRIKRQETLKEAAEKYVKNFAMSVKSARKIGFNDGAKWQQEQIIDFLHSEITERRNYSSSKMCEKVIEFIEQFKNK